MVRFVLKTVETVSKIKTMPVNQFNGACVNSPNEQLNFNHDENNKSIKIILLCRFFELLYRAHIFISFPPKTRLNVNNSPKLLMFQGVPTLVPV